MTIAIGIKAALVICMIKKTSNFYLYIFCKYLVLGIIAFVFCSVLDLQVQWNESLFYRTSLERVLKIRVGVVAYAANSDNSVEVHISKIGDASHIEFVGLSQTRSELEKTEEDGKSIIKFQTKNLKKDSLAKLQTYSDDSIQKIEVQSTSGDDASEIKITLRNKELESFAYSSEQPVRWILDIFMSDEAEKRKEANLKRNTEKQNKLTQKAKALPKKIKQTSENANEESDANENSNDNTENIADEWPAQIQKTSPSKVELSPLQMKKDRKPSSDGLLVNPEFINTDSKLLEKMSLTRGAFDGGDPEYKRFDIQDYEIKEESLIASQAMIYIHFPMLKLSDAPLEKLLSSPPIYRILPLEESTLKGKITKEQNDEAKLLVNLFEKGRYAIFLKTAKEFYKEYPETPYDEIIKYMMADTYYKFYQASQSPDDFETAMNLYIGVSEKYKHSPLTARTYLFIAYTYLAKGENLNAIKAFQSFLDLKSEDRNFDQNKTIDQIKIAQAQAYLNLGRPEDSYKILDEVEHTAKEKKDAVEAAFHKGDIYFQNGDYKRTVQEYSYAQKKYQNSWVLYPNAYFNTAEAQFWLGNYKESLKAYREFLQKFPQNSYGGYAMTRIAELLSALGADPNRVKSALLESSFRYKDTPGGEVARIRLLSERMPEMKEKELKSALDEIAEIEKTVNLPGLDEFTRFMQADGLYARGEFDKATADLIQYYQANPIAKNREKYKLRIERNITTAIKVDVEKKKFLDSLRVYSKYAKTWLNNSNRIDTEFYVGRAYELAGVHKQADQIYRESLNKLYSIKGTEKEKIRSVFETLPTPDQINLRLAAVAQQEKEYAKSFDYLKQIKKPQSLTEEEQVERADISAIVLEERGDVNGAKKFLQSLLDTWKGQPAVVAPLYLRLAKLEMDNKEYKAVELNIQKILNLQSDSALVSEDVMAQALELKGDAAIAQNKRNEAVKSYQELLTEFDQKRALSSVRYKLGQLQFKMGDLKDAERTWAELKNDKNDKNGTWYKLAEEKMNSDKWRSEYKKYIERIPAMSQQ